MTNLSKLTATALTIGALLFGNTVKAQMMNTPNPWRFGIGVEGGIPTGELRNLSNYEIGGTARLQYDVSGSFAVTATSGYYDIIAKNSTVGTTTIGNATYATTPHSFGMIPVKFGVKAFFANSLYVSGETGVGFETEYSTNTKLILSPGIGWASKSVDVGVRYENFYGQNSNYGLFGLRIAYGFGL